MAATLERTFTHSIRSPRPHQKERRREDSTPTQGPTPAEGLDIEVDIGVEVVILTPNPTYDGIGFSLHSSHELAWELEEAISRKIRNRVLATIQKFGGYPSGGLAVVINLKLPSGWVHVEQALPSLELAEAFASNAAESVDAVLTSLPRSS